MIGRILASLRRAFRSAEERKLSIVCRGDEAQLERLIAGEMSRRPGTSRREAVRMALERLKRDH